MKLYILRWNPTFSMKYKYFNSMMDYLHDDEIDDFNWSIYDHEDLEVGDMFILAQVGTGALDGIAGFGIFNSQAENKIRIGVFDRGDLKFGRKVHKDWIIEGEFNMGLENGYIVEYDQLKRKQFEGTFKDGKREGFGIRYYDNGNISYKGFFTNDLEDKFGFMYNSSGKVFYVGHIDKGQKRGFGIYYAYDQKGKKLYKYIGNWINDDTVDGYLLKKFADGDYFFGFTKMHRQIECRFML